MSLISDALRIKEAKEDLREVINSKLETPVSDNALIGTYPTYIESICDDYDGELSTIEDRISDDNDLISDEKTAIEAALVAKGVTVPSGSTIEDLPALIADIPTTLKPYKTNVTYAYISKGEYIWENKTNCRIDIYEIENGVDYFCTLGGTVGTRFRIATFNTDPSLITSGKLTGTNVLDTKDPAAYASKQFISTRNGYVAVMKDDASNDNIPTYLIVLD